MRFLSEGPNIPDELLEERDSGNVVFLCGAGVSYPAGMPDFLGLAKYVIKELGTPQDAPSREMLSMWEDEHIPTGARPSLDQIFNLLQQEYQPAEIDDLIAKRLKTKPRTSLAAHETILRLSSSADGKPQVVTTNFDLLFEKAANRNVRAHVAPALPDLAGMQSLDGIVYLHGRLNNRIKRGDGWHELVVSSSDFGRAYLAEGWATRFVRDLLDQYIVVLLGYSASDPPVRYLLQGLHTRGRGRRARLFAFDSGTEEEVQHRWRKSGVHALTYSTTEADHSALWNTLSAWAERADDHLAWRRKVVDLARKGPRNLVPHERGQVASLVRTDIGAKLFADADPSPSGEWLCVFDYHVRYGDIGRDLTGSQPLFDPLEEYQLDADPPRPAGSTVPTNPPGDDLLGLRSTNLAPNTRMRLAGLSGGATVPLPSRLFQLIRWIVKVVPEPVTAWWAARYDELHPDLLDRIDDRISQTHDQLPGLAGSTWRLLIERRHVMSDDDVDLAWYQWLQRWNNEGWTKGMFRAFEQISKPYLTSEALVGLNSAGPPTEEWSKLHRTSITRFKVAFPGTRHDRPEVPDEALPAAYRILRNHLETATGLLTDIDTKYWKTTTFYPEPSPGETYLDHASTYLLWFRELFDRMIQKHPEQLRADITLWPAEEPFFFDKLRLYAWTSDVLFSGKTFAEGLLALSDRAFWEPLHHRELLHLLRRRWRDVPPSKRRRLERRFASGPPKYAGESEEAYEQRRSIHAATNLGWLEKNGCQLSNTTLNALRRLRRVDPDWRPEWDEAADESYDAIGGIVLSESDPAQIIDAPLDKVVSLAVQHTGHSFSELKEHRPFDGLVKQRPRKAVAALTREARKGNYPTPFWDATLQEWPEEASLRLVWVFCERLARLPSKIVAELQSTLFRWIEKCFLRLAGQDRARFLRVLDTLLDKLFEGGPAATKSGIGEVYLAGQRLRQSRRTLDHAINGPVGRATEILLNLLSAAKPKAASHIPTDLKSRLERLIVAPGEGGDHAICTIARRLRWLDYVDPDWTRSTILSWFDPESPAAEPAWNGFLHDNRLPEPALFSSLKLHFLNLFAHASKWNGGDHTFRRLHEFLVIGCFRQGKKPAYISYDEVRHALQQTDDKGRAHSINCISRAPFHGDRTKWRRFGKPFLRRAWPTETRCQTHLTSRQLVALAQKARDSFPEVVEAILPLLVPFSHGNLFVHGLTRQSDKEDEALATRFPDVALALIDKLVPDGPDQLPYNLGTAVEMIAEKKPSLRKDSRWRRLNEITLQR